MSIVLITGMSGVGKSTLLAELSRRGERTVDTDTAGLVLERFNSVGQVVDHLWDEAALAKLVAANGDQILFLAGCVSNQGRFYRHFSSVVLLSLAPDVLLDRISSRTTNSHGKDSAERTAILADLELVEPLLRATATIELDGTLPVSVLADRVQSLAEPR